MTNFLKKVSFNNLLKNGNIRTKFNAQYHGLNNK